MPIYEYDCTVCSTSFDRIRSVEDVDLLTRCPDCGGISKRKLSLFLSISSREIFNESTGNAERTGGSCCGGGCSCSARSR